MQVGRDPARVVERAGLNERDRAICRAVAVNVRAAVATEEPVERVAARTAVILVAARTAALDAEPEAGRFFNALASFYRKAYLRWIDATKRRPDVRAARIAELIQLLKAGHKQRPQ